MEQNNINFVIDKIEDLAYEVKRFERYNRELSELGLSDLPPGYGISFKEKMLIFKDGTKEKINDMTIALLRGSQSTHQKCAKRAQAVVDLCEQGSVQPMNKKTELSRLYGQKSFLYQTVADMHKFEKFKKELHRAKTKTDGEAIVALVKILKKIGY